MSNSKLVDYVRISPNSTNPRNKPISKITIHHVSGYATVEGLGELFANPERDGSSNYGISSDGRVGMYVEEANRSWCSSSRENDHMAVTIEVANDEIGGNWHVSDTALSKLIELCVDICRRNNIEKLNYTGDATGNLTMHKWFANTNCPGPYLSSKFPYIAEEVNKRLGVLGKSGAEQKGGVKVVVELLQLQKGSKGSQVKCLQRNLKALGYIGANGQVLAVDGDFGSNTDYAVRRFQKDYGLAVDGIFGQNSWNMLLKGL